MTSKLTAMVAALAAAVALGGAPSIARATCGDVNGNGSVEIGDPPSLAAKIAASMDPTTTCGAAHADCDVFKDSNADHAAVNHVDINDLTALAAQVATLKTLFDPCDGPGPKVACAGANDPETGLPTHDVGNTATPTDITANETWPSSCTIHILGTVFIRPGASKATVVSIEPGTVVKAFRNTSGLANPAVLIFLPGARIDAAGTFDKPIIMTSGGGLPPIAGPVRGIGDWGGVLLNGKSTVNRPNCVNVAEGIPAPYGGCIVDDNSGVMTYTRVEFSGIEFTPNNELNIITLNGVGTGTTLDYIQGNAGGDDCIEWFGGTVNVKHFVSSGCADDGFDWQLGTTGKMQYGLQVQYGPFLQTGNQSRGIEADNSEFGADDLPRSNPKFCNLTMIGARDQDVNAGSQGGIFYRRGTGGNVANSIVTNYRDGCTRLDDASTAPIGCTGEHALKTTDPFAGVQNTLCFDNGGTGAYASGNRVCSGLTTKSPCTACEWYEQLNSVNNVTPAAGTCSVAGSGHVVGEACSQSSDCGTGGTCGGQSVGTDPQLSPTWGTGTHRWDDVLASGGGYPANVPKLLPANTGGFPTTDCHLIDDSLDKTNYIGAFNPAAGQCVSLVCAAGTALAGRACSTDADCANWLRSGTLTFPGSPPTSLTRWISFDVN